MDPILFLRPSSIATFATHRSAYAAIGVRFVVAPVDMPVPGFRAAYTDALMTIYQLPGTRPYWSAPGCVIDTTARTEAMTICDRPARLTRLELMMPGWTATVNGIAVPVSKTDEIFQSIALPAGRAAVSFDYAPPHIRGAANAALVGLLLFLGQLMTIAWSRRTMTAA